MCKMKLFLFGPVTAVRPCAVKRKRDFDRVIDTQGFYLGLGLDLRVSRLRVWAQSLTILAFPEKQNQSKLGHMYLILVKLRSRSQVRSAPGQVQQVQGPR